MGLLEMGTAKFDTEHCKVPTLRALDFRVPRRGELYLGGDNKLHRLKEDRIQSRRAKPRLILEEIWDS